LNATVEVSLQIKLIKTENMALQLEAFRRCTNRSPL